MIDFNIISTGSKGNAIVINKNILIDCGVSFKRLQSIYRNLSLVLLTHIHSDHFNKTTIKRLAKERPSLRFGCCEWLVAPLIECGVSKRNIDVFEFEKAYDYKQFKVEPIPLVHNVPNTGYKVHFGEEKLIYATDTNNLNGIEAKNYDLYLIEANYEDEEIKKRIAEKEINCEYCYEKQVLKNHLSKAKCDKFLAENCGDKSSFVYMHQHEELKG